MATPAFRTDRTTRKNTWDRPDLKRISSAYLFQEIMTRPMDTVPILIFKISNGYLKLGYQISDHFDVAADFSMAAFDASDPGPDTLNASPGETIDILRGYGSFLLRNNFEKSFWST